MYWNWISRIPSNQCTRAEVGLLMMQISIISLRDSYEYLFEACIDKYW